MGYYQSRRYILSLLPRVATFIVIAILAEVAGVVPCCFVAVKYIPFV